MLPNRCQVALKEWAVTVDALARGAQILLLRKGGIHEEGKDFRVIHPEFLLYPTYEHQREDLLKAERQPDLARLLSDSPRSESITFSHFAKVEELLEVEEQEKVDDLSSHHIWTDAYAQSRLHWKPMLPLSIMLLRVYHMEQPATAPFIPEYGRLQVLGGSHPPGRLGATDPGPLRRGVPARGRGHPGEFGVG